MFIIDLSKLKAGDIILTRGDDSSSLEIQRRTGSHFNHAMIYLGASSYIDSNSPGVHAFNILRKVFNSSNDVVALRSIKEASETQINEIIQFARVKVGTAYSLREALRSEQGYSEITVEENRQFCTRFVAQAYHQAGFPIVKTPDYCTPKHILESELLIKITDVLTQISIKDITYTFGENSVLNMQADSLNKVLGAVKTIFPETNIQTLEQLSEYVFENPEKDAPISQIILDSGYLNTWKTYKQKNNFLFNPSEAIKHFNALEWYDAGSALKDVAIFNKERFDPELTIFTKLYKQSPLKYYKLFVELYTNLLLMCDEMLQTAHILCLPGSVDPAIKRVLL